MRTQRTTFAKYLLAARKFQTYDRRIQATVNEKWQQQTQDIPIQWSRKLYVTSAHLPGEARQSPQIGEYHSSSRMNSQDNAIQTIEK